MIRPKHLHVAIMLGLLTCTASCYADANPAGTSASNLPTGGSAPGLTTATPQPGSHGQPTLPQDVSDKKDYIVVSRNPDFVTFALSSMSILLTVMTVLLATITGVGVGLVLKVQKERKESESLRRSIEDKKNELKNELRKDYDEFFEAMKKTSYSIGILQNAKSALETLLSGEGEKDAIYKQIEKTIHHPDDECIRLYGRILQKYDADIDIVRLVRNGLLQFGR